MEYDGYGEEPEETNFNIPWWLQIVLYGIIAFVVVSLLGNSGKYEGQTAEEWFNEYDWIVGCIEEHPSTAGIDCL